MDTSMDRFPKFRKAMTLIVNYKFPSNNILDRACGVDDEVKDYPYIYFVTPNPKYLYRTVCVSSCPSDPLPTTLPCAPNSLITSCDQNLVDPINQVVIYNTNLFNNRVCLPDSKGSYSSVS